MDKTYARITDDVAVEIFVEPPGFSISDCLRHEVAAQFREVPTGTLQGAVWDGMAWKNPSPPAN